MQDYQNIKERIKKSYCSLTSFKERSNGLEIITAYSTINKRFVSVFVTIVKERLIITDNGWINQNYYETPIFEDSEDIIKRVKFSHLNAYNVKTTTDKSGIEFHYKSCNSIDEIPSAVFDLANCIVGIVNAYCVQYKDEKEERERETFRQDANTFLQLNYEGVRLRSSLDDIKSVKFNAIIIKKSRLHLITYVTGSTPHYFENDLRKSIVNFEITAKSRLNDLVKERISIINNNSEGYQPDKSASIIELLSEKTTREPIKWSEKEKILELI